MKIEIGANEANQRLDRFLRKLLKDVPLGGIYKSLRCGEITVNGLKKKNNYQLQQGDIVNTSDIVSEKKQREFIKVEDSKLKICYEDKNLLLVEKWPGVLVHSDDNNGEATLTDYVLSYLAEKNQYDPSMELTFAPAPCNRLDRNTSGIVIFGKNFETLQTANEMIKNKDIEKYYYSIVKGRIKDGIYTAYITKDENSNRSKVYDAPKVNSKKIEMEVKSLESCGTYSFIEIKLLTGRSHQLRAHLAYLGNPIIGDTKYGEKKINAYINNKFAVNYQYLYAYKVIFRNCQDKLSYLQNKTVAEALPPVFKKIKNDIFKFD